MVECSFASELYHSLLLLLLFFVFICTSFWGFPHCIVILCTAHAIFSFVFLSFVRARAQSTLYLNQNMFFWTNKKIVAVHEKKNVGGQSKCSSNITWQARFIGPFWPWTGRGGCDRETSEKSRQERGGQNEKWRFFTDTRVPRPPPFFNMAAVSALFSTAPIGEWLRSPFSAASHSCRCRQDFWKQIGFAFIHLPVRRFLLQPPPSIASGLFPPKQPASRNPNQSPISNGLKTLFALYFLFNEQCVKTAPSWWMF